MNSFTEEESHRGTVVKPSNVQRTIFCSLYSDKEEQVVDEMYFWSKIWLLSIVRQQDSTTTLN